MVWKFFDDANALPVAVGDIMDTDMPPSHLVFPRSVAGTFFALDLQILTLMRDNYALVAVQLKVSRVISLN